MLSANGKAWVKEDDGQWSEHDSIPEELDGNEETSPNDHGAIAGVSIASIAGTIILGVIIVLVIFGAVKYYKRKKRSVPGYMSINDSANDQGLNPANDPPSDSPTSPESV